MQFVPLAALGAALAAAVLAAACSGSVRTPADAAPGGIPADYPPRILESAEHRAAIEAEWQRLFDDYKIAAEGRKVPTLAPFTHTPESTFGTGTIRLAAGGPAPDEERVRLLLRNFIADRAQLLGVAAPSLSLEAVTQAGGSLKRYSFAQTDYPHPIVLPFGRLDFLVGPSGDIQQIQDSAIPSLELPTEPRVTREAAARSVVGATFTYGDIAGRPQSVTVSDPAAVAVRRLVVYPEATPQALFIRLAWEIEAGSGGLTWTVYVDAITGQRIATRQNFQT